MIAWAVSVFTLCAQAQWLDYKTPGIPRSKDGKVNLAAPAPRLANGKPDFSGVWQSEPPGNATVQGRESLKARPWAEAIAKKRKDEFSRDSPGVLCLPLGPDMELGIEKIVQTPNILVLLYGGTSYRQIFLDGRSLEKNPNPDWMGYSVGHWDGDTLVVESNGFNDRTWLDGSGHPHTEQLRVAERFRRLDFGHIEVVTTMTDPGALEEPWTVPSWYVYDADTEPLEYVCNENERDRLHMVGKESDAVQVPAKILSEYTGVYQFHPPNRPDQFMSLQVAVENNQLVMKTAASKQILTPLSQNQFGTQDMTLIEFVRDSSGAVTLVAHLDEGEVRAVRNK